MAVVDRVVDPSADVPEFTVHVLPMDGGMLSTRSNAYEPVRLRQKWAGSAALTAGGRLSADTAAAIAAAMEELHISDWLPPVSRVLVGHRGTGRPTNPATHVAAPTRSQPQTAIARATGERHGDWTPVA